MARHGQKAALQDTARRLKADAGNPAASVLTELVRLGSCGAAMPSVEVLRDGKDGIATPGMAPAGRKLNSRSRGIVGQRSTAPQLVTEDVAKTGLADHAKIASALRRVGFTVGGTVEIVDTVSTAKPGVVELRHRPCGPDGGDWVWSGTTAALLDILDIMTDGDVADERLGVTFFVCADDLATALRIGAALRSATWRKGRATIDALASVLASEPESELGRGAKTRGRGAVRR